MVKELDEIYTRRKLFNVSVSSYERTSTLVSADVIYHYYFGLHSPHLAIGHDPTPARFEFRISHTLLNFPYCLTTMFSIK